VLTVQQNVPQVNVLRTYHRVFVRIVKIEGSKNFAEFAARSDSITNKPADKLRQYTAHIKRDPDELDKDERTDQAGYKAVKAFRINITDSDILDNSGILDNMESVHMVPVS